MITRTHQLKLWTSVWAGTCCPWTRLIITYMTLKLLTAINQYHYCCRQVWEYKKSFLSYLSCFKMYCSSETKLCKIIRLRNYMGIYFSIFLSPLANSIFSLFEHNNYFKQSILFYYPIKLCCSGPCESYQKESLLNSDIGNWFRALDSNRDSIHKDSSLVQSSRKVISVAALIRTHSQSYHI